MINLVMITLEPLIEYESTSLKIRDVIDKRVVIWYYEPKSLSCHLLKVP